jgi:hypothetical protein
MKGFGFQKVILREDGELAFGGHKKILSIQEYG